MEALIPPPHLVTTHTIRKTFSLVFYSIVDLLLTPITHSWKLKIAYLQRGNDKSPPRTFGSQLLHSCPIYKQKWDWHTWKPQTVSSHTVIVTCSNRSNFTKYMSVSLFSMLVLDWGEAGGGREEQVMVITLQPCQHAACDCRTQAAEVFTSSMAKFLRYIRIIYYNNMRLV